MNARKLVEQFYRHSPKYLNSTEKVFVLSGLFHSIDQIVQQEHFHLFVCTPWKKCDFKGSISFFIFHEFHHRWEFARSHNVNQKSREVRESFGNIGIRAWVTIANQLSNFDLRHSEPVISFVWPSEDEDDPKGLKQLEALFLKQLTLG